jgi:hypothetical protein
MERERTERREVVRSMRRRGRREEGEMRSMQRRGREEEEIHLST